jgi:putative peptidoglycan lipid II flippase
MVPAAGVGMLVLWMLGGIGEGSFALERVVNSILASVLVSGAMVLCYLVLLWLFKVPELREVFGQLKGRFGGK